MIDNQNEWWLKEGNEAAKNLFRIMRHWDLTQAGIQATNVRHLRLYSNRDMQSLSVANYILSSSQDYQSGVGQGVWNKPSRLALNVIKSAIDTLTAKVGKNKIKPSFLTSGGTVEQKKRSEMLNQFLYGLFHQGGVYSKSPMAFRDGCIYGTGVIKVLRDPEDGKKIIFDKVLPDEITCDPADAYYGEPRSIYQRKFVSKSLLKEFYPEKAADLDRIPTIDQGYTGILQDTVLICEAWHKGTMGAPGKHILCCDGVMLQEMEWKGTRFPFAFFRYTQPPIGFWGIGVAEELTAIQVEINRLLYHISEALRLMSFPRIFLERGSKINKAHLTNEIGGITEYSGTPPIIQAVQAVHPELFTQLNTLYQRAFEIVGISQLSAQSKKPAGLNSGAALREYNDIESERFQTVGRAFEDFHVDLGYAAISVVEEIGNGFTVSTHSFDGGVKAIKWGDVKVDRDDYVIQCFPTSALPQEPGARLEFVQELINSQLIEPQRGVELLNYPDLQKQNAVELAPLRIIDESIERMIFEGVYVTPEPYIPLQLAIKRAQAYYCWAVTREIDEDRLELIRQYIDDADSMRKQMLAESQAPIQPLAPAQAMLENAQGADPTLHVNPSQLTPNLS